MRYILPEIRHDKAGFEQLSEFHSTARGCLFDDIEIDMEAIQWFDADMCAAFGAILHYLVNNINKVYLVNLQPQVNKILLKNGFLSHYGSKKIPDKWGTTISYHRFDIKDDRYFSRYVENELISRAEMPEMSPELLKRFRSNIFEIFSNAVLHSRTELGVFSCGQYFPTRNRLDFTVADLGIGIRQNIKDVKGLEMSSEEAIIWATKEYNTTKRDRVPGGLGLKLLREFIKLNGGCLRIVSGNGYWEQKCDKNYSTSFSHPFPGTVVTIEINTADKSSYCLAGELNSNDIF